MLCRLENARVKWCGCDQGIRKIFSDDTIIVVASAYDTGEIESEAKMAGANIVVPKPMFQSTVFDLLMELTGGNYHKIGEKTAIKYSFKGKKVLVAEDNTLNAQILMDILDIVELQADRAKDGKEAYEMFEKSPAGTYDAVLMDIQMPIMQGHEVARKIRSSKHPQAQTIPIIAVTANSFMDDVKEAKNSGMNALVAKPIDSEHLYATLAKYIG